jgi:hypothetical protein
VAAADFGFFTLIQVFDGPERYGASSFFETMPSNLILQTHYGNHSRAEMISTTSQVFGSIQARTKSDHCYRICYRTRSMRGWGAFLSRRVLAGPCCHRIRHPEHDVVAEDFKRVSLEERTKSTVDLGAPHPITYAKNP